MDLNLNLNVNLNVPLLSLASISIHRSSVEFHRMHVPEQWQFSQSYTPLGAESASPSRESVHPW
jgi:hypothetical protein